MENRRNKSKQGLIKFGEPNKVRIRKTKKATMFIEEGSDEEIA